MRQHATCSVCEGRIWRSDLFGRPDNQSDVDAIQTRPWVHSSDEDWVGNPHNGVPVPGTESGLQR